MTANSHLHPLFASILNDAARAAVPYQPDAHAIAAIREERAYWEARRAAPAIVREQCYECGGTGHAWPLFYPDEPCTICAGRGYLLTEGNP
jgi:hypothetical protein